MLTPRTTTMVAAGLLLAATGCGGAEAGGTESTEDWGPLAVLDVPADFDELAAHGPGTLRVGEDCVTLEIGAEDEVTRRTTLVWRAPEVTWEPQTREIVFEPLGDQEPVRLSDGDRVHLGGSGFTGRTEADWGAPPDPDCPDDFAWYVHDVGLQSDEESGVAEVEDEIDVQEHDAD